MATFEAAIIVTLPKDEAPSGGFKLDIWIGDDCRQLGEITRGLVDRGS